MSSNKRMRQKLEKQYGSKCMMHEGLKIKGYSKCKCHYKGKSIMFQLTVHHIQPRSENGQTTERNCALLCRGCHDYLEQSTPAHKQQLNQALLEYKKRYNECKIVLVDDLDLDYSVAATSLVVNERGQMYNRTAMKRQTQKIIDSYYERSLDDD